MPEKQPISFVYFGTPYFASRALDELYAAGLVPELIVTSPDKPAGRGLMQTPPAVKTWAIEHSIPFIQPASLKEVPPELLAKKFDVFIIAAYGKILRPSVLDLPTHGCVNLHPSLLPMYRGAAPIDTQILAGEEHVGVSVMLMDEHMDTGPVLAQKELSIPEWPIGKQALTELLAIENGKLTAETVPAYVRGEITPKAQNDALATYTKKIEKADGQLDLSAPARQNYLKYLAYEGWPGTFFFAEKVGKPLRVKITHASFADNTFTIERVIPEGKREMMFTDFLKSGAVMLTT
jgi:methionyl-tRNA formyltransferase